MVRFSVGNEGSAVASQSAPTAPCPAQQPAKSNPNANGDASGSYNPPGARNTDSCISIRRAVEVVHDYATTGPAPGDIAFRWIHGSVCAAKNTDPRIQMVAYNEDTYILRENPCISWEAPFTYLLFGNKGALLIDTGATPEAAYYPLRATVDAVMRRWCDIRGKKSVPLTVVVTSGEDVAQNQGAAQFAARPETTVTPLEFAARQKFHAPGKIDLGGRVIDVIATPGAHKDGMTFYDPYTCFLFPGDLLYPGRVQIANDRDYVASLARLREWKQSHAVKWVMGGHVEMMFIPGRAYPRFSNHRPFEHVVQLEPDTIDEALEQAKTVVGRSAVAFRTDFILLNRVSPDEKVYQSAPDLQEIPVPFWLSLSQ